MEATKTEFREAAATIDEGEFVGIEDTLQSGVTRRAIIDFLIACSSALSQTLGIPQKTFIKKSMILARLGGGCRICQMISEEAGIDELTLTMFRAASTRPTAAIIWPLALTDALILTAAKTAAVRGRDVNSLKGMFNPRNLVLLGQDSAIPEKLIIFRGTVQGWKVREDSVFASQPLLFELWVLDWRVVGPDAVRLSFIFTMVKCAEADDARFEETPFLFNSVNRTLSKCIQLEPELGVILQDLITLDEMGLADFISTNLEMIKGIHSGTLAGTRVGLAAILASLKNI